MPSVSNKQIPISFRANRPVFFQWLGRSLLTILGWKVLGKVVSDDNKSNIVAIAAPHTSNWDGVLGVAAIVGLDVKVNFIGKHTVFKSLLGTFLKYLGGIPVNRQHPGGVIKAVAEKMKDINCSLLGLAPEGTRSKVKNWKTGFLRIAEEINAKIILVSWDFKKKEILLGKFFTPSGDYKKDIEFLKNYYKSFAPKIPENF